MIDQSTLQLPLIVFTVPWMVTSLAVASNVQFEFIGELLLREAGVGPCRLALRDASLVELAMASSKIVIPT